MKINTRDANSLSAHSCSMIDNLHPQSRQKGAALGVSLILMTVVTMLGISSMSGSQTSEQIASNQRQATDAFMAAEIGIFKAKNELDSQSENNWESWDGISDSGEILQRPALEWSYFTPRSYIQYPTRITIESTGTITTNDVSRKIIIDYYRRQESGNLAPINILGRVGEFNAARSQEFKVFGDDSDGGSGPAISTTAPQDVDEQALRRWYRVDEECTRQSDNREEYCDCIFEKLEQIEDEDSYFVVPNNVLIQCSIDEERLENYVGGIREVDFDNPFGDPERLMDFIGLIKASVTDDNRGLAPEDMGDTDDPKITVFEGNLELGGNDSGAGILLVDGNLSFKGTPAFNGLILVTGDTFEISGGGTGGVIGGSIVFANPVEVQTDGGESEWQFGEADAFFDFDVSGGGTAEFKYDEGSLETAKSLLLEEAKQLWVPEASEKVISPRLEHWREAF